ncbi:hypothetical protein [Pseudoalteromonas luteoviolacea]|uniref:Uncharacterized protein n=1 Tax=Pseudoalteromonas luteoviolacea DSM 6061 TaxID=1365250 RepID=A0A166YQJ8_9GAMM|nr:hypothetical protein [Pseudoalteromonas luteoviolacea]KZN43268.1 hypothetical protein N475_09195 [Pseudoalteromonas luteoviolacea DSM 6061]KZN52683.1 hypothetical protein N474_22880 [Pseudoalteromonas luteoviolacea CPMOR-2]MBE0385465.1 hypothetical protein [Pseudoalteromonas luteoviolacea DSM 6061]TQF70074.1 hypothetical protein FLM44_02985 [Pseudoalteromonas luteoviolacea]
MPKNTELDDLTFLKQFKELSLDPVYFDHIGHIRIACLYLNKYSEEEANTRVCHDIKVYAESLGAKDKFNITVTATLVKIIARRINVSEDNSWKAFIINNQDLVTNAIGVLAEHMSKERMFSATAKVQILTPDLKPL